MKHEWAPVSDMRQPCAAGTACLNSKDGTPLGSYGTWGGHRTCSVQCAQMLASGEVPLALTHFPMAIKHRFSLGGGKCQHCSETTHHTWEYGDMIFRACKGHVKFVLDK